MARIAWLENIIRTQLPCADLGSGPLAAGDPSLVPEAIWDTPHRLSPSHPLGDLVPPSLASVGHGPIVAQQTQSPRKDTSPRLLGENGLKRPFLNHPNESDHASSLEQDTRSVALGLGFLSLNSDSRQLHYLGSSSGSLLASMVQTGRPRGDIRHGTRPTAPSPEMDPGSGTVHQQTTTQNMVQFDILRTSVSDLYAQLRRVSQWSLFGTPVHLF